MAMVIEPGVSIVRPAVGATLDPIFVSDEDLEDLSTFFFLPKDLCLRRLKAYSPQELADRWNRARPRTAEEIIAFYQNADQYVWELMQWHASPGRHKYWHALAYIIQHFPPDQGFRSVLDFGCGIGTDALFLARHGYSVTLVDVNGPAFRFAQHRFQRRRLPARFVESRTPLPDLDDVYDIILCFDVFEHLPDPAGAARRLVTALRPEGVLAQSADFRDDGRLPCHLGENIRRFFGLRWHIHLAGMGLRFEANVYRKATGPRRILQRFRYALWRLSGIWITWVRPQRRLHLGTGDPDGDGPMAGQASGRSEGSSSL